MVQARGGTAHVPAREFRLLRASRRRPPKRHTYHSQSRFVSLQKRTQGTSGRCRVPIPTICIVQQIHEHHLVQGLRRKSTEF